jgi:hypothetical protein
VLLHLRYCPRIWQMRRHLLRLNTVN